MQMPGALESFQTEVEAVLAQAGQGLGQEQGQGQGSSTSAPGEERGGALRGSLDPMLSSILGGRGSTGTRRRQRRGERGRNVAMVRCERGEFVCAAPHPRFVGQAEDDAANDWWDEGESEDEGEMDGECASGVASREIA